MSHLAGLRRVGATSTHVIISTASLSLLQWAIMAIIARIDGPIALGHYALAQAFATPGGYLAWLSLRQQLIISQTGTASPGDFAFLRIVAPALVLPALLGLVAVFYSDRAIVSICAFVFLIKYAEGFFDLTYGRMQATGDTAGIARTALTRSLASIAVFLSVYLATGLLGVGLLSVAATYFFAYALQARDFPPLPFDSETARLDRAALERRARITLHLIPFAFATVLMAITSNAPRVILENSIGPLELGYFAAVFHFVAVGAIVVGSVSHATMPLLTRSFKEGRRREFWITLLGPMLVTSVLCALGWGGAMLVGSTVVRAVYGPAFEDLGPLLAWGSLTAAPVYAGSLAAAGVYAVQRRGALVCSQAGALVVVIAAGSFLVPRFGSAGAFSSMAVSAFVQIVLCVTTLVGARPAPALQSDD